MVRLEWIFLMQIVVGIIMIVYLFHLLQMKKQIDAITKEVSNYIAYVTEDIELEQKKEIVSEKIQKEEQQMKEKRKLLEAQNTLILGVLKEYFP